MNNKCQLLIKIQLDAWPATFISWEIPHQTARNSLSLSLLNAILSNCDCRWSSNTRVSLTIKLSLSELLQLVILREKTFSICYSRSPHTPVWGKNRTFWKTFLNFLLPHRKMFALGKTNFPRKCCNECLCRGRFQRGSGKNENFVTTFRIRSLAGADKWKIN